MTTTTEALLLAREALAALADALDRVYPALSAIDAALAQEPYVGTLQTDPDYAESEAALRAQETKDERAAFEAWWKSTEHAIVQFPYAQDTAWEAWRAAKASI